MRRYILADTDNGESIAIEWDKAGNEIMISYPPVGSLRIAVTNMREGVVGGGNVHWSSDRFDITEDLHQFIMTEYPGMSVRDVHAEYFKASKWCTDKKREVKDVARFITNWFRRARGGEYKANGVAI